VKKILIALDNGTSAERVAEHGFRLGKQLDAEIALLSVVDTRYMLTAGAVTVKEIAEITKNEFRNLHAVIINKFSPEQPIAAFIKEGNPYELILESADHWQADIIVMGTHGRTGLSHLLLGSVAEKVIRHSKKQVLVIPVKRYLSLFPLLNLQAPASGVISND